MPLGVSSQRYRDTEAELEQSVQVQSVPERSVRLFQQYCMFDEMSEMENNALIERAIQLARPPESMLCSIAEIEPVRPVRRQLIFSVGSRFFERPKGPLGPGAGRSAPRATYMRQL